MRIGHFCSQFSYVGELVKQICKRRKAEGCKYKHKTVIHYLCPKITGWLLSIVQKMAVYAVF